MYIMYICFLSTLALVASLGTIVKSPVPKAIVFKDEALIGTDKRAVSFRFMCTQDEGPKIQGALSLALELPKHDSLRNIFDFDELEGPDSSAGSTSLTGA